MKGETWGRMGHSGVNGTVGRAGVTTLRHWQHRRVFFHKAYQAARAASVVGNGLHPHPDLQPQRRDRGDQAGVIKRAHHDSTASPVSAPIAVPCPGGEITRTLGILREGTYGVLAESKLNGTTHGFS